MKYRTGESPASSACVYNVTKQQTPQVTPLREDDAYPAMPEDGYGWEKLFSERMCRHFREDYGLQVRVARYHNVYGPYGTWYSGREKAPAAMCRKVIEAADRRSGEIEVWGNGQQTRSFLYIDDCIEGTQRIMTSDIEEPVNLGSEELKQHPRKDSIARKRKTAALDCDFLAEVLAGATKVEKV